METITIQVDAETAKAYRAADPEKQEKVSALFKLCLQTYFTDKSLSQVMAEIADNAEKRGLTPEILESILNDDA
jgi:hypothetical protein